MSYIGSLPLVYSIGIIAVESFGEVWFHIFALHLDLSPSQEQPPQFLRAFQLCPQYKRRPLRVKPPWKPRMPALCTFPPLHHFPLKDLYRFVCFDSKPNLLQLDSTLALRLEIIINGIVEQIQLENQSRVHFLIQVFVLQFRHDGLFEVGGRYAAQFIDLGQGLHHLVLYLLWTEAQACQFQPDFGY